MLQTILYVDDDLALARLAQRYLGRAGYDVVHAADSSSALEALENGSFSAIVLDHYLRSETGLQILAALKPAQYTRFPSSTSPAQARRPSLSRTLKSGAFRLCH
jgi:Response regulator containing CheY-like receiver, AAA-type ATPase, and DNA-binding domains